MDLMHRHYSEVLIDTLKHRCRDSAALSETCQKISEFLDSLRFIHRIHLHYLRYLQFTDADSTVGPPLAIKSGRAVTVQEALDCGYDITDDSQTHFHSRNPWNP